MQQQLNNKENEIEQQKTIHLQELVKENNKLKERLEEEISKNKALLEENQRLQTELKQSISLNSEKRLEILEKCHKQEASR